MSEELSPMEQWIYNEVLELTAIVEMLELIKRVRVYPTTNPAKTTDN